MTDYRGGDAIGTQFLIDEIEKIDLELERTENDLCGIEKSKDFDPDDIRYCRRLGEKTQLTLHVCELRLELAKKIGTGSRFTGGSHVLPAGIKRMCEAEFPLPLPSNTSLPTTNREGTRLFIFYNKH
jgi:hypothetical protein